MSIPPFIAFASHPALRQRFLEARPMLVFDAPDGAIVWANAAGARLFGYPATDAAIGAGLADPILRRQFTAAADRLLEPGDCENLTIHLTQRFRRVATTAMARLFVLAGKRYFLLECEADGQDDASLVQGPQHLALVDGDGRITLKSDEFAATGVNEDDIAEIALSLSRRADSYIERLVTNDAGIWPVALGRLSSTPDLFLLAVSPDLSAELRPHVRPERLEPAAPQRSARDAIAAIDESLGALMEARVGQPASPVVRKQPEPALPGEAPADAVLETALPLRFVWRTDIAGRIVETSGELVEAVGAETGAISGLTFAEIESQLGVKGAGAIGDLLQTTETWSGRSVEWPLSDTNMVVPVDLAALPTFTRERRFDGFRGFGLVRLGEQREAPRPVRTQETKQADNPKTLTADERHALDEIASQLRSAAPAEDIEPKAPESVPAGPVIRRTTAPLDKPESAPDTSAFDRSENPIVIQAGERVLYANPAFLAISGYGSLDAVIAAGGTDAFVERGGDDRLFLRTADGDRLPVSFHMQAITWNNGRALALTLRPEHENAVSLETPVAGAAPKQGSEAAPAKDAEVAELSSILDTATDGILILDGERKLRSLSASAAALFATDTAEVAGKSVDILFAEESHSDIRMHLDRLSQRPAGEIATEGLEVIGRESGGGLIPLYVTLGPLPQSDGICVVLRDITALKRREDDLRAARREARQAEDDREAFISALRYEVRQPIEAIVSLSETLDHQPFGAIGDARYHGIAREIATKGRHARGVIGRLLGEPEPEIAPPPAEPETKPAGDKATRINDAVAEAVSMVQPRANSRRIIIRAALSSSVATTTGSPEPLRQIAHELLLGAVQFTPAGGQVVVSTALTTDGGTVLRFRDNGIAPSRRRVGNGGARTEQAAPENTHLENARRLAESLGARLVVQAVPNEGMLVEVFLPERQARPLHY
ncbi:PAS domain-containing sensor histidine kinase [Martelella soudanensis]|uniref:PAS domain-containing sensor histidine kinase n=1 Tax=unclassified Martelella TaxID=2629616 RepID=UPI0015DD6F08|nr:MULTISPECIES: PAS domain S-box protein [unclassified Martelella]